MTIYQQELMRKLSQYGCNGSYSENEETLSFSYNGIKIGWMKKNGSICGVVDVNMPDEVDNMFFIIQKQAKEICEYVRLYNSPDYAYVKEAFAVRRAGLIDKDCVISEDEAADIYRCVDYARGNCETLTHEQERQLDFLAKKLQYGYPQFEISPPTFEQDGSPQLNL